MKKAPVMLGTEHKIWEASGPKRDGGVSSRVGKTPGELGTGGRECNAKKVEPIVGGDHRTSLG